MQSVPQRTPLRSDPPAGRRAVSRTRRPARARAAGRPLPEPRWLRALAKDPIHGWVRREWRRMAAAPGARFDERTAQIAVEFFPQHLCHTAGKWAGRPFHLGDWQAALVRFIFGWKRADGTRLIRRALVWIARKNGKTELAAGIALAMLVLDATYGGEVYSIAKDKKQASIVFKAASVMVGLSDGLRNDLEPFKTSIYCPTLAARFEPLSGAAEGKHGLKCTGLIGDEAHEWPDGDLYSFVHQSEASAEQPLEFIISTAGRARWGYGWTLWEESRKIADGIFEDPSTLVVDYMFPANGDWTKEKLWRFANPNLNVSVDLEFLRAEHRKARESSRVENNFRRYHLNQWTGQEQRWLPMDKWARCTVGAPTWQQLPILMKGRDAFGGLDLSSTSDLTSNVWVFPPDERFNRWILVPRIWVPAESIERRSRRDRVPYDVWHRSGAILQTDGNVVDYDAVRAQVVADAGDYVAKGLAVDRLFNAHQIMNDLQNEGLPVVAMGQGFLSMSQPAKDFERLVLSEQLEHGGHPVLWFSADNVAIDMDPAGNIKPSKKRSSEKIDPIVSAIMGVGLAMSKAPDAPLDLNEWLANPVVIG